MAFATHADAEAAVVALEAHACRILATTTPTVSPGIVNTTTKTDMFSFTVPAASVAAGDLLILDFGFDLLNNSGGTVTYAFEYKLGATVVLASAGLSYATGALRAEGTGRVMIALASLTDQRWGITQAGSVSAATQILLASASQIWAGTSAENLATDKTLSVAVTMNTASASADVRPIMATLTRMR